MSPIGKNKCSYSPMQKRGLINSPMKKEDEKTTVKFKANENKKSDPFDVSQKRIDEAQARVNAAAQESGTEQSETLKAERGNLEGYATVWKKNKGGVKDKYKSYKDFVGAAEAWWQKKNKTVNAKPGKSSSESEIQQVANPVKDNINTNVTTNAVSTGNKIYNERYDPQNADPNNPGFDKNGNPKFIGETLTEVKNRNATKEDNVLNDESVVIGETGDETDIQNALDQQTTETEAGLEEIRNENVNVVNSGGG